VDPEAPLEVLADHARTFDRDQRVELPGHVHALVEQKRRAHQSRGFDRLFGVVPSSRAMMVQLAERGANLGATTSGLLQLLDRVGAETLERAVAEVVAVDAGDHDVLETQHGDGFCEVARLVGVERVRQAEHVD
jgi:hypothetical protein